MLKIDYTFRFTQLCRVFTLIPRHRAMGFIMLQLKLLWIQFYVWRLVSGIMVLSFYIQNVPKHRSYLFEVFFEMTKDSLDMLDIKTAQKEKYVNYLELISVWCIFINKSLLTYLNLYCHFGYRVQTWWTQLTLYLITLSFNLLTNSIVFARTKGIDTILELLLG